MESVGNSFQFAIINDGSQLSYNLTSDATISQTWIGGTSGHASPDFSTTQPTVYLVLRDGSTFTPVSNVFTWKYNGQALSFDANNVSTGYMAGVFKKVTVTVGGVSMPGLQILQNLMTSAVSSVAVVRFEGKFVQTDGSDIDIIDEYQIPLTEAKDGTAYKGVLKGKTYLENDGDSTTITAELWNPAGVVETSSYVTWWSKDDGSTWQCSVNQGATPPSYTIGTADIEDKVALICEFWPATTDTHTHPSTGTPLTTEVIDIDDISDPYEMAMRSVQGLTSEIATADGFGTGDRASLRDTDSVKIQCYPVRGDGNKRPEDAVAGFNYAYCYVRDFNKQFYDGPLDGFNNVINQNSHWRQVSINTSTHIATQILSFAAAQTCGGSGEIRFMLKTSALT